MPRASLSNPVPEVSQPVVPATGPRAFSQKDLPPSVEAAYYRKCIELRRRIHDIEENNDGTRLRIKRLNRAITKMRLERAFILEALHKHMEYNVDDSDRSSSPPPTPTDKPLRSKRSHRQKTPPGGGAQLGSDLPGTAQQGSPGSTTAHRQTLAASHLMSSAQSTPDPSGRNPFFSAVTAAAASPQAINGTSQPAASSLSARQTARAEAAAAAAESTPSRGRTFDPAYDETPAAAGSNANAGSNEAKEENGDGGDTEMGDAPDTTFASVNG
ncbi:hypothetical protein BU24DRAFT_450191 [Aaosphaeria arxii CBS 175.79]|uniref:INO80 complex subunit F domain-containing protein n=1 Tax=Aaosphaeria arxii CBS 175.79 TaxID=1450172 RepID=A0A6A5XRM1_9PLEO|nr:uncharacterized protein BU24DRAFT_450191 [Aaosphaeria arxii CBS 175.79]KAF2015487.1 hypothetical protein BU24DRAFT_450191 [Aaosphaeria arxii CBS 175.79]